MIGTPAEELVARFRQDLAMLVPGDRPGPLGIAVSGGADSLALLLLARAAFPNGVAAATVDHGLRAEAAGEARTVSEICANLGIPHATLRCHVQHEGEGWQAAARDMRYAALAGWCAANGVALLLTAHHADDQAETLLMRLARGSGVAGLSGIRAVRPLADDPHRLLVRPLLGWRKADLVAIVAEAGLAACDDPSNRDQRFDRTAARALLAATPWLDSRRIAASAHHLAEGEAALAWMAAQFADRLSLREGRATLDPAGLPAELVRRLLLRIFSHFGRNPRGPEVIRLAASLAAGATVTLAGIKAVPDAPWRFEPAPPRRNL